ncbi:MAG: hypothetical protein K1X89_11395 [Myxococcaceae bacterium]|nr:hypothetical protein [Myxococcaceae bacterium]
MSAHGWFPVTLKAHGFYRTLEPLFDRGEVEAFTDGEPFSRQAADGFGMFLGSVGGRRLGVVACDFRVAGASFGKASSRRLLAFVRAMGQSRTPIFFQLHTMGVRLTEGRTVFHDAFQLIPALSGFAARNLLITSVHGNCLGLGAILYGLGHAQYAVTGKSFNLTGPEVFKMFFGEKVDYQAATGVERVSQHTEQIHELVPTSEHVYAKVRALLTGVPDAEAAPLPPKLTALLATCADDAVEVLASKKPGLWALVARQGTRRFGLIAPEPGRPNLLTVDGIAKCRAALKLFARMRLPVVSLVDTAGTDPRLEQSDRNVTGELVALGEAIAAHRHGLLGVVVGRAFGGASLLAFPRSFGSDRVLALQGARIDIMDPKIVGALVSGSARLREQWDAVVASQGDGLGDLVEAGIIDGVISAAGLRGAVRQFLEARARPLSGVVPLPASARSLYADDDVEITAGGRA